MNPKISVLVTHFNQIGLIEEALTSVMNQTYENWELILVDDGSETGQFNTLKDIVETEGRIKLISQENAGACIARNRALENATGDYVIFLDGDDLLSPTCLEERVGLIHKHTDLDFIVSQGCVFKNEMGDRDLVVAQPSDKSIHINQFLHLDVGWVNFGPTWKKSSLDKFELRWSEDVRVYQDVDFHLRALLKGMKYEVFLHEPNGYWRWGLNNRGNLSSKRKNKDVLESNIRLWKKVNQILVKEGKDSEQNKSAIRRHLAELVLRSVRKGDQELSMFTLDILKIKQAPLLKSDYRVLGIMVVMLNQPKLFKKFVNSLLYHLFLKKFHRYTNKYFLVGLEEKWVV